MRQNCSLCGEPIDNRMDLKGSSFRPRICSTQCFIWLLGQEATISESYINGPLDYEPFKSPEPSPYGRSQPERRFAEWCRKNKVEYEYEPYIFILPIKKGTIRYVPDFLIKPYNIFVEIKYGLWEGAAYKKLSVFHKHLPIFLVDGPIFTALSKLK